MGGSGASTQLEPVAIFLAFVLVTTLFSFVSLGACAMEGVDPAPVCVYPVLTAEDPHLAPVGEIICRSSVQDHIDTLTFIVVNTNESGTVDLSRATVTVMAGDFIEVLTRSKDSSPGPGTWTPSLPGDNDGTIPLPAGEECTIQILLDRPIPAGTTLTIRVRLPGALPCLVTGVSGDDVAPDIGVSSYPEY